VTWERVTFPVDLSSHKGSATQQKLQHSSAKTAASKIDQPFSSCNTILTLEKGKTNVVRFTQQTQTSLPQLSVSKVQ
jgi:hypothetical protein